MIIFISYSPKTTFVSPLAHESFLLEFEIITYFFLLSNRHPKKLVLLVHLLAPETASRYNTWFGRGSNFY
jgi:hypothetical protein